MPVFASLVFRLDSHNFSLVSEYGLTKGNYAQVAKNILHQMNRNYTFAYAENPPIMFLIKQTKTNKRNYAFVAVASSDIDMQRGAEFLDNLQNIFFSSNDSISLQKSIQESMRKTNKTITARPVSSHVQHNFMSIPYFRVEKAEKIQMVPLKEEISSKENKPNFHQILFIILLSFLVLPLIKYLFI